MCGIVGIHVGTRGDPAYLTSIGAMNDALWHRGPDGDGVWTDDEAIAFGHRRLSIIDLSPTGAQPMCSASGRFVLTYNGELYNTGEIRNELSALGVTFRGTSDTEVLVNAIELWGLDRTLEKINGIYAFGCWDRRDRRLVLARDRFGVKPLFWGQIGKALVFASELRSIALAPGFDRSLNLAAVGAFLQYNYIRSPMTIYAHAHSLAAGCAMSIDADGAIREWHYWDLAEVVRAGAAERAKSVDDARAIDELDSLIGDAVRRQLISDVPIGAFLSSGVDSSLVVSMMRKVAAGDVRTFSIGFEVPELNEAVSAAEVARALGTNHTELYVTEKEALDCVPQMSAIYDQPLADPSNIPTYLLCKLAREHVTVALSGDGGDEMFCGYQRFERAAAMFNIAKAVPRPLRALGFRMIDAIAHESLGRANDSPGPLPRAIWHLGRMLRLTKDDPADAFQHFLVHWIDPALIAPGAKVDDTAWKQSAGVSNSYIERLMYFDAITFMTDCVLAKVDRASMSVGLEVRVPLLDHRIAELAWRLPQSCKFRDGVSKWALREVLYRHVPRALVDRPKQGFGAPVGRWLRGPLRDWAEAHLSDAALKGTVFGNTEPVRRLWQSHVSGRADTSHYLWSILQLQSWLGENR